VFEQTGVVRLHALKLAGQPAGERADIRKTAEAGEGAEPLRARRQGVGLFVGEHLQAVLDHAQKTIRLVELGARHGGNPAALLEPLQRDQGLGRAQLRLPTAGDQLLGLNEEFDLADAAASELDVMAGDGNAGKAVEGVDLAFHRLNVGDGREIEVLAPDVGGQPLEQLGTGGAIAGDGAGLDERGALPVLTEALVVVECG